ncbi:DnaJ domain-containing protein [Cyanobacterium aponinum UTEX 3221]|uniref:DnaJ domain-containing protein n=1 Tax=Cyanobacterium aponinum TaxID=379064 RepID=UPI002B4C0F2D|nr:DnaJ domain-containing protein [Cyanobacterium aponinum]WRL38836.1 DnaJ domain-containing protein [Cyanobacterium aponinum UTEX 3221]
MDIQECYQVLGLPTNANDIEVKKAYLKLAKKNHPDLFVDATAKEIATEKFIQINEAYQIITSSRETTFGETNNNQAKLLYNFGVYSAEIEDFEEANQYFSQAIKLDPFFGKAYFYRGIILEKQGFNLRAESDFNKYYELKSESTNSKHSTEKEKETNNSVYYQKVEFKKPVKFKLFTPIQLIILILISAFIPLLRDFSKNMEFIENVNNIINSQNLSNETFQNLETIFNSYGGVRKTIETGHAFCEYLNKEYPLVNSEDITYFNNDDAWNNYQTINKQLGEYFVDGKIPNSEAELIAEISSAINLSAITYLCPQYINLYKIKED